MYMQLFSTEMNTQSEREREVRMLQHDEQNSPTDIKYFLYLLSCLNFVCVLVCVLDGINFRYELMFT